MQHEQVMFWHLNQPNNIANTHGPSFPHPSPCPRHKREAIHQEELRRLGTSPTIAAYRTGPSHTNEHDIEKNKVVGSGNARPSLPAARQPQQNQSTRFTHTRTRMDPRSPVISPEATPVDSNTSAFPTLLPFPFAKQKQWHCCP